MSGFDEQKNRRAYTVLKIRPCYVTQVKTVAKDGYRALQIGFADKSPKNINKVIAGKSKKAGIESPLSFFKEIRLDNYDSSNQEFLPGQLLDPTKLFAVKDKVQVSGVTKAKGFAGVVKRHGFSGGPKTHGQSDRLRAPGSIGSGTTPGRVWKGKKMAGRMGKVERTIKGLTVAKVGKEELVLQGLVPGAKGTVLTVIKQD